MSQWVAAFYYFTDLEELPKWQGVLKALCEEHQILGTILLAPEGINSTIAGEQLALEKVVSAIHSFPEFSNMPVKYSKTNKNAFRRLKVLIKNEIVNMGVRGVKPHQRTGVHVSAKEWQSLLEQPDIVVLDVRNNYEIRQGSFVGAIDPKTEVFNAFPDYVKTHLDPKEHPRIAMFCTGGIRCEKASAWMLQEGFKEVYQLDGGILKYLEETPERDAYWQGECFIFDDRGVVRREDIPQ